MNVLDRHLVEAVAQRLRADPGLIEKDWHVTRALEVLAAFDHGGAIPSMDERVREQTDGTYSANDGRDGYREN